MTNTLFAFVDMARSTLSCVWIETGNPKQPLACVWIDRELRIAQAHENNQSQAHALCAHAA